MGASTWASGRPGVEGKHRNLDGKSDKESDENPGLQVNRNIQLLKLQNIERPYSGNTVLIEVERQNTQQQEHGTGQGVEEELDGRHRACAVPPRPR